MDDEDERALVDPGRPLRHPPNIHAKKKHVNDHHPPHTTGWRARSLRRHAGTGRAPPARGTRARSAPPTGGRTPFFVLVVVLFCGVFERWLGGLLGWDGLADEL